MRRGHRHRLAPIGQELNLVPYMDIMVNLVLFMLVTITSFLSFTILNASIPQLAPDSAQAEQKLQKEELMLVVRVLKEGYRVDPSVQGGAPIEKKMFPNKDGKFDTASLHEMLIQLKDRFKDEDKVLIIADPTTNYDVIIQTMDASRENVVAQGKDALGAPSNRVDDLFPDVTLSIL